MLKQVMESERSCKVYLETVNGKRVEPLCNKEAKPQSDDIVGIWLRAGISLNVSKKQVAKILQGDTEALESALKTRGSWKFDGETYIPEESVEDSVLSELMENTEEVCLDFNLNIDQDEIAEIEQVKEEIA